MRRPTLKSCPSLIEATRQDPVEYIIAARAQWNAQVPLSHHDDLVYGVNNTCVRRVLPVDELRRRESSIRFITSSKTVNFQASRWKNVKMNFQWTSVGNKVMAQSQTRLSSSQRQAKMSIKTASPVASVSQSTHKEVDYRVESGPSFAFFISAQIPEYPCPGQSSVSLLKSQREATHSPSKQFLHDAPQSQSEAIHFPSKQYLHDALQIQ